MFLLGINKEYAYKLLENEKMPGWLFMASHDTTSIWEGWEGIEAQSGIASLNHYSKGAVVEFLYSKVLGINVEGENSFSLTPVPGGI
jgi:alpha-L-rhamnosidase